MKYNNFKEELNFLNTKLIVNDPDLIKEITELIESNQPLPDYISVDNSYIKYDDQKRPYYPYTIYKNMSDDEIEAALKISQTKSLHSISKTLSFFKVLTVISLIYFLVA